MSTLFVFASFLLLLVIVVVVVAETLNVIDMWENNLDEENNNVE